MKTRTRVLETIIVTASLICVSCNNNPITSSNPSSSQPSKNYQSVFSKDLNHEDGFYLQVYSDPNHYGEHIDQDIYLDYNKRGDTSKISWHIAQWYSPEQLGLHHATYSFNNETNTHTYKNAARELSVTPSTNTVYMSTNSGLEYKTLFGEPKLPKEKANINYWSHYLIQRNFDRNVCINDITEFRVQVDFTLNYCMFNGLQDADRSNYEFASQIFMYFTVYSAKTYRTMWFGLPFYDSRYNVIQQYVQADIWSSLPIYSLPSNYYLPVNEEHGIEKNKTYHIDFDILPHLKSAINGSSQYPAIFPNEPLSDIRCSYLNYGFEMPGAFFMGATISNLNVITTGE